MVPAKHNSGFPTDRGGINFGHPGFETNTVYRCVENHILTAQNREISSLHAFRKERSKWSLETGASLIFLCD